MKVKIKTWDKMVKENELNYCGDIGGPMGYFVEDMEESMPKDRIIEINEENCWATKEREWSIEYWMIEEEIKEEDTLEKIIGDL